MKISRRSFIRFSTAFAAFNIAPSHILGRTAPSRKIVMGMIGVGGMGTVNMNAFLHMDDVVVRAVCDVNVRKLRNAKAHVDQRNGNQDCAAMTDFRELCARDDIDAVMLATPNHSHAMIGILAAQQGKDIYAETPFAHTLSEGTALAESIARHRRVWQTGSWQRTQSPFRKAVAAVQSGRIGKVVRIEIGLPGGGRGPATSHVPVAPPLALDWRAWQGNAPERAYQGVCDFHWRWVSTWGGGILADWIGHHGDIALWGADRKDEPVSAAGQGVYPRDGLYDTATAFRFRCMYRDGMELLVADGGQLEKGVGVRWIGRSGEWVWVTRGALESSEPQILEDLDTDALGVRNGLHRDFIDCVMSRQPTLAPADAARKAANLGHFGEQAMRA